VISGAVITPGAANMKREWKTIAGLAFILVAIALSIYQLYGAWAYRTLELPLPSRRGWWVPYEAEPAVFFFALAIQLVILIVSLSLFVLLLCGWRWERLGLQKLESGPPLDRAIREPSDGRAESQ
jgi:H+/Cl- antiporter ClcA